MGNADKLPTMPRFKEHGKKFVDILIMELENGIPEARMHADGGPARWCPWMHRKLVDAF